MKWSLMQNPGQRLGKGRLRKLKALAAPAMWWAVWAGKDGAGVHLGGGCVGPSPATLSQSLNERVTIPDPTPEVWAPEVPGRTWVKSSLGYGPTLPGFKSLLCFLKAGG